MPVTEYIWDDVNDCVLEETDELEATQVTYTHEPGSFGPLVSEYRGGTTYNHHYDALGSTTMLTDDTGAVTDTFQYDAWGDSVARTGSTPTPYTWVGRWGYQDDSVTSGGYSVRARTYQPIVARWTSVDPLSRYYNDVFIYANNVPIMTIDVTGLSAIRKLEVTPEKPRTETCVAYDVDWKIKLNRPSAHIKYVTVIVNINISRDRVECNDKGCDNECVDGDKCTGGCNFYELLGVIYYDKNDNREIVKATPPIPGLPPQGRYSAAYDFWHWKVPKIPRTCLEKGSRTGDAHVQGHVDNDLTLFKNIVKEWNKPGDIQCDCPNSKFEVPTQVGIYTLKEPAFWKQSVLSYKGYYWIRLNYNCCGDPSNFFGYGNEKKGQVIKKTSL